MEALYNNIGEDADELIYILYISSYSFTCGDVMVVKEQINAEWLICELGTTLELYQPTISITIVDTICSNNNNSVYINLVIKWLSESLQGHTGRLPIVTAMEVYFIYYCCCWSSDRALVHSSNDDFCMQIWRRALTEHMYMDLSLKLMCILSCCHISNIIIYGPPHRNS